MCSACSDSEYREVVAENVRASRRSEAAGRYDGYRSVAPHLRRVMELRQELQQVPPEANVDSRQVLARESCEHIEQRWDASWGAFICMNGGCRKVMVLSELWSSSL